MSDWHTDRMLEEQHGRGDAEPRYKGQSIPTMESAYRSVLDVLATMLRDEPALLDDRWDKLHIRLHDLVLGDLAGVMDEQEDAEKAESSREWRDLCKPMTIAESAKVDALNKTASAVRAETHAQVRAGLAS